MTISIIYKDGTAIILNSVQSIRLVFTDVVEVKCFDNEPVIHRGVLGFTVNHKAGNMR